jgi:hypothetical protein
MSCRRYIPSEQDTAKFLKSLQTRGISHVVLRWFEELPHVEPGEDIDILVSDADAPRLLAMVETQGTGQPLDIYSASGTAGLSWRGAPYLPPQCARNLLARRTRGPICDHPCPDDHWLSLAFHTVWHKGQLVDMTHDYAKALKLGANDTIDELAKRLDAAGWRPGLLAQWRWRRHNPLISERLAAWRVAAWPNA